MIAAAVAALLILGISAGLVAGRSAASRIAAAVLVAPTFALPWMASDNVFVQVAFTFASAVMAMKVSQIAYGVGPWSIPRRIWNMLDASATPLPASTCRLSSARRCSRAAFPSSGRAAGIAT